MYTLTFTWRGRGGEDLCTCWMTEFAVPTSRAPKSVVISGKAESELFMRMGARLHTESTCMQEFEFRHNF